MVVTGIGLQTCFGDRQQTWAKLLQGKTGIRDHQPFIGLPPRPLARLSPRFAQFETVIPSLVTAALEDAGLTDADSLTREQTLSWGVVVGSSRGCQKHWEQWLTDPEQKIPWLQTFPYQAANLTARCLPIVDLVKAPMAACATGLWAIAEGVQLIHQGRCQQVIAGAVEMPITPLTLAGFERMGALATSGCYPFDQQREGLALGEGGVLLVLEKRSRAQQRGIDIYGEIAGWGFTCDAFHRSTPDPSLHTAQTAVTKALKSAPFMTSRVDFIHPHGTGTVLNDQREAALIQSLFPADIPITTSKGAIGHTLGASGAIATALSLLTIRSGKIPPCIGLITPAFDLNFAGVTTPGAMGELQTGLVFCFGFGGQNAVIGIRKSSQC